MPDCSQPLEAKKLASCSTTNRAIWAVMLGFVVLATVYAVITPLFEAPDELFHYPFVKYLADGHGLPVLDPTKPGPWNQEGGQPPLYYALAALVSRWAPSDDLAEITRRNPHASIGVVQADGNANIVLHTERESFPYHGAALAVHLARLLSTALGAVTVMFTYRLGLEVLPHRPGLALTAAVVVASTPMFLFLAGAVNNDNLIIALSTVALWQMARLLRRPATPARLALLGVTIGLAALSKVSGLALVPLAGLVLGWIAWRERDWRLFLRGGACIAATVTLVAGWWYSRNWTLYRDPLGWNAFMALAGSRARQPTAGEVLDELPGLFKSYWGVFGWFNVAAPAWFYQLWAGLVLAGACGLAIAAGRRLWRRQHLERETIASLTLVVVWPALVLASLVRWTVLTPGSQGRLAFPAIACVSYLLALGWWELWTMLRARCCLLREAVWDSPGGKQLGPTSPTTRSVVRGAQYAIRLAPMALMAALAVWTPFGVIAPAYARPPLLTAGQIAAIPQRLDLVLGDQMELLGYRLDRTEARPGDDLRLTLYWRARAQMDHDYSVFVHLLDQNEMTIAQRDSYPGGGTFATTLWRPGDAIADTYVISVPSSTFRPNRLQFEVGLYWLDGGERLPVRDAQGRALGSSVRLGEVAVGAEPKGGIANPVEFNFDNQIAVIGYDLDRVALRPGEVLHLTLFWKALAPLGHPYTAFAHILGSDGTLWAGKAGSPRASLPANSSWRKGQVLRSTWQLALPPDTPPGDYYVETGLYPAGTGQGLNVLDRWGHPIDRRAILTRIRVLPAAPAVADPQFKFPAIQHPLDVTFGQVARLRGFSLESETVNPHEPLRVTLYWEAISEAPAPVSYKVFVHLLDPANKVVAQHDSPPAYGLWPTTSWVRGQAVVDEHTLSFRDTTYSGAVLAEVGLYDPQTLERLATGAADYRVVLPVQLAVRP